MAGENEDSMSLEIVLQRHKKEAKDLQATIQSMKRSVPKGDKKRKKEVTLEISRLEKELRERHKKEIEECKLESVLEENQDKLEVAKEQEGTSAFKENDQLQPRISKAQKRRDKKAAKEKEMEQRIKDAELENEFSARNVETEKLGEVLAAMNLSVKEINPDGHCLYNAIADQLSRRNQLIGMKTLRQMAADYMLAHQGSFLPFLVDPNTDDLYTQDQFVHYCEELAGSAVWGGHLEIQALSQALKMPIEVYQANSPVLRVGEEYDCPPILLSYHHHAYGLGEHYNSVIPSKQTLDSAT